MKTVDLRVLVDDDTDTEELTRRLLSTLTYGSTEGIHGAAVLDEQGIPVPQFMVKTGLKWDGWPREGVRYSMGMSDVPELSATPEHWHAVKVYQHGNGPQATIVAAGMVAIRNGQPDGVTVKSDDGLIDYVTDSEWEAAGCTWACSARIEGDE